MRATVVTRESRAIAIGTRLLCIAVLIAGAASAHARGVSPYLPLARSPEIERAIERAMILAGQPIVRRPIAAATVLDALPRVCERDAILCERVETYLDGYTKRVGLSHASIAAAAGDDVAVPLPNRHGLSAASDYELSAEIYWQPSDYVIVTGGVNAAEDAPAPTGSMVSIGNEHFQVDVGYRDHWYSPMTDSAMLIGTQAETMPSVTVSNYTPLSRLNFRYEIFLAEMSESDDIAVEGGTTSGSPRLAGMHLSIEPFPGWSFAVNRIIQFGGGERGGDSFNDFFNALFDPNEFDNTGTPGDFGNQAASFTAQWLSAGALPYAVYFEYAGEDTSRRNNTKLGNVGVSAGLRLPRIGPNLDLTFEIGERQNGWYVHHIYGDGLVHEGGVIGHWGADWRVPRDPVGARSAMARIGWEASGGALYEATLRTLENESYTAPEYERGHSLDLRYSRRWNQFYVGGELNVGEDTLGNAYSRASAFVRF